MDCQVTDFDTFIFEQVIIIANQCLDDMCGVSVGWNLCHEIA